MICPDSVADHGTRKSEALDAGQVGQIQHDPSLSGDPAACNLTKPFERPVLGALDDTEDLIGWSRIAARLPGLWCNLSDLKLSAQLARDLLFLKFCRLELD